MFVRCLLLQRNPIRRVAIDFAPDKLRSLAWPRIRVILCGSWVEVISAFPRKVLEIADRRGADRTSDRVGAAQE